MNDVSEVAFGILRLAERLDVPFVVERSRPDLVVPPIPKDDFSFPMIPSVLICRLNHLGLLPPDTEVCGDVDLIDLVLSSQA